MRAYSQDLRDRVIESYKNGSETKMKISKQFMLSYQTVCCWIKRYKEDGDYSSKQGVGCGRAVKFKEQEKILEYLELNPDANAIEIRDSVAPKLAMSTFYDTLARFKISYKKKEPKYKKRSEVVREEFIKEIATIAPEELVYIDESGVDNNISVEYGWSKKGVRSYAEKLGFASNRRNIVAGYNCVSKDIIAPFEYKGYTDKALFVSWFKNQLCPELSPGQVVILDNASFHKDDELFNIIEEHGCRLIYLPPYSPDLNPIEKFWANFKRNLRKLIKKFDNFLNAITAAMNATLPG